MLEATQEGNLLGISSQEPNSMRRWRSSDQFATAKEAFGIPTPLPSSSGSPQVASSVVGYPALVDPGKPIKLFEVKDSDDPFIQEDLARVIPPGEIAILVLSYYPTLNKEEIPHKRNVGHACLGVGIQREDGTHGVLTINNPQTYLDGAFSIRSSGYESLFIQKFDIPSVFSETELAAYKKNIVTMTVLANTYIGFPSNYNGGDPLGIYNLEKVHEAGEMLILAVYGDEKAQTWLEDRKNLTYCAELVSAGINIGANVMLTKRYLDKLSTKLGSSYSDLYEVVSSKINSKSFLDSNKNTHLRYLDIGMVDEKIDLLPILERFPDADDSGTGLAFKYYDFADIVYGVIRDTYPRKDPTGLFGDHLVNVQKYNAEVSKIQIQIFRLMAEKFKKLANLDALTLAKFDSYVEESVIPALSKVYPTESKRNSEINVLIKAGKEFLPILADGKGMFIPPDLYLMPTKGWADLYNAGIAFPSDYLEAI